MNLTPQLTGAFREQLDRWPEARSRYEALRGVETKLLFFGDIPLRFQHNPARAVSTAAKVDDASIAERPCFLCRCHRPSGQFVLERFGTSYEVLLNPFPIFPLHLTVASTEHQHQDTVDFADMSRFAETHPGLAAFYNGSHSGASAPDHLHFQATQTESLPLCAYIEENPGNLVALQEATEFFIADDLPAKALHIVSASFTPIQSRWLDLLLPPSPDTGFPDRSMRNVVMWKDAADRLHTLLFPRSRHRPACYGERRMVSPGAVDMTGLIILPRRHDFDEMTVFEAARILEEVSYDFTASPVLKNLLML